MKKSYIKPKTEAFFLLAEKLMLSNSEEEWGSWIGAKENNEDSFFDDVPFGSLWDDDPVEDPFAIGD